MTRTIMPDPTPDRPPLPKLICSWCVPPRVLREGSEPASHGLCPDCAKRMREEREALDKDGVAW